MKTDKELLSLPQIMGELKHLCDKGKTGTMFITSDDNHSARFALQDGKVFTCAFSQKKGFDALPLIKKIKFAHCRFADGVFSHMDEIMLPGENTLFDILEGDAAAPASIDQAVELVNPDMNKTLRMIEQQLSQYIGPIAEVVCEEYLEDIDDDITITDLGKMINSVSTEIDDVNQRAEFMQHISSKLN